MEKHSAPGARGPSWATTARGQMAKRRIWLILRVSREPVRSEMGPSQQGRIPHPEGAKRAIPKLHHHRGVSSRCTRTKAGARKSPAGGLRELVEKHSAQTRSFSLPAVRMGKLPWLKGIGEWGREGTSLLVCFWAHLSRCMPSMFGMVCGDIAVTIFPFPICFPK